MISLLKSIESYNFPTFIMLVGVPGSGKSEFAKNYTKKSKKSWMIVSPDIFRKREFDNTIDYSSDREIFSHVHRMLNYEMSLEKNIIYDATNCNKRSRLKIMDTVQNYDYLNCCFVFNTSLYTCFQCNRNIDHPIPEHVIEKMYVNLKNNPPNLDEGFHIIGDIDSLIV